MKLFLTCLVSAAALTGCATSQSLQQPHAQPTAKYQRGDSRGVAQANEEKTGEKKGALEDPGFMKRFFFGSD